MIRDLSLIALLGLIPLTWFVPGHYILSVDFNLPFTWDRWVNEVFYSWIHHLGTGQCPRMIESTHFFFLVQWLFQFFGLSLLATQRAVFVFWFALPGFTFYFLMRYLLRGLAPSALRVACLAGVAFYMFNLYLEPIWLGVSISNMLAYAFLPLMLRLWIQAIEEKRSPLRVGFILGVLSLAASGIATNPANVFVTFIPFIVLTLIAFFRAILNRRGFLHLAGLLFFTGLFIFLFNFYWIWAEIYKVFDSAVKITPEAGRGFIVEDWLNGISSHTSFWNVIRMLGCWTWWAEPRPYATVILHSPLFVALSWLIPVFGFAGLAFKSRYRAFFAWLLGIGIVLSMGVHFPFRSLYFWLVENLPFFWLVRSPWFKFMMLVCVAYSYFMGVAAARLYLWGHARFEKQTRRRVFSAALAALLILFPMGYAYPVTLGKMFLRPGEGGFANHFKVPAYVERAAAVLNAKPGDFRIWDLPGKGSFINQWGFVGFTPFAPYLVAKPILYTDHNLTIPIAEDWLSPVSHAAYMLQNSFEKELTPNLYRWLGLFHADTILAERDFRWEALAIPFTQQQMLENLSRQNGVHFEKSVGEWDLYRVEGAGPHLYLAEQVSYVEDNLEALVPLCNTPYLERGAVFFAAQVGAEEKKRLLEEEADCRVILQEKEGADLAVDAMAPSARSLIRVEKKGEKPERPKETLFHLENAGEFVVFVRKGRALALSLPRSRVDQVGLPQELPIDWNSKLAGAQNWISIDRKPVPAGEDRLAGKDFGEGAQWQALGMVSLTAGKHSLALLGELPEPFVSSPEIWTYEVRLVSKLEAASGMERIRKFWWDRSRAVTLLLSTEKSWREGAWSETDPADVEKDPALELSLSSEWGPPFLFQGSAEWRQIPEGKSVLRVLNRARQPKTARLAFEIFTPQSYNRNLSVLLNGKEIKSIEIPKLKKKGVALPMEFQPGENEIHFRSNASPEPLDRFFHDGDQRQATLLARQITVGNRGFRAEVALPPREFYQVRIYPFFDQKEKDREFQQPRRRDFEWNGKKVSLKLVTDKMKGRYWESPKLRMRPGKQKLSFVEREGKDAFIEIAYSPKQKKGREAGEVKFRQINPTLYEGTVRSPSGGWLIFAESHDSRWELSLGGETLRPVPVNGFANAYWVASTGEKEKSFQLEFIPQRKLNVGIRVSGVSLAASSFFVLLFSLFSRRNKRSGEEKEA